METRMEQVAHFNTRYFFPAIKIPIKKKMIPWWDDIFIMNHSLAIRIPIK